MARSHRDGHYPPQSPPSRGASLFRGPHAHNTGNGYDFRMAMAEPRDQQRVNCVFKVASCFIRRDPENPEFSTHIVQETTLVWKVKFIEMPFVGQFTHMLEPECKCPPIYQRETECFVRTACMDVNFVGTFYDRHTRQVLTN